VASHSPWRHRFDPRSLQVNFVLAEVTLRQVFRPSIVLFLCQRHSINAPCSSSPTRCSYLTDKRAKTGNFPKCKALSHKEGHWVQKYLHFFLVKMFVQVPRNSHNLVWREYVPSHDMCHKLQRILYHPLCKCVTRRVPFCQLVGKNRNPYPFDFVKRVRNIAKSDY
jgi:hypothetical protein